MTRRTLSLLITASLVLGGCRAKEAFDKAKIASDLDKKGTMDLLKETSKDHYDAPKDGKLTEAQIQMYLKVREHEKAIAQVAKQQLQEHGDKAKKEGEHSLSGMMEGLNGLGSLADLATADIRAAKDLGYNTAEYQWVKGQILAASTSAWGAKMADAMSAQMQTSYDQAKKAYDEAKDEQTKQIYKQTLDAFDQQKKEMAANKQQEDPALAYNRELLSKHEDALKAWTTELSKYEDKKGEAEASAEKAKQDLEKAATGKQ